MDKHHVAGRANSPVTISIHTNDHRAVLSVDQYDWPKGTLENTDGSPLIAAAACIRGFISTIAHLTDRLLTWIVAMLELLDVFLTDRLGSRWWINTNLNRFAPKENHNAKL